MSTQGGPPPQIPHKTEHRIFTPIDHVKDGDVAPLDHMLYADDDVDLLIWWAEPGGTALELHKHPNNAHVYFVLQGEGEALLGSGEWVKVKAGQAIVNPKDKVHSLRNTMSSGKLVWASVTCGPGPYQAIPGDEKEE